MSLEPKSEQAGLLNNHFSEEAQGLWSVDSSGRKSDLIGDHSEAYLYLAQDLQSSIFFVKKWKVHLCQRPVSLVFKSDGKKKNQYQDKIARQSLF